MLRAVCDRCRKTIYLDTTTGNRFDFDSTEYPHKCEVTVAIYAKMYGIEVPKRDDYLAGDIIDAAVNAKLNLNRLRIERRGDKLYLSEGPMPSVKAEAKGIIQAVRNER